MQRGGNSEISRCAAILYANIGFMPMINKRLHEENLAALGLTLDRATIPTYYKIAALLEMRTPIDIHSAAMSPGWAKLAALGKFFIPPSPEDWAKLREKAEVTPVNAYAHILGCQPETSVAQLAQSAWFTLESIRLTFPRVIPG